MSLAEDVANKSKRIITCRTSSARDVAQKKRFYKMRILFMINLLLTFFLFSCSNNTNRNKHISNHADSYPNTPGNDSSYVATGFYFLAGEGQGIKMQKDHSTEVYTISKKAFASINNLSQATAQKM